MAFGELDTRESFDLSEEQVVDALSQLSPRSFVSVMTKLANKFVENGLSAFGAHLETFIGFVATHFKVN